MENELMIDKRNLNELFLNYIMWGIVIVFFGNYLIYKSLLIWIPITLFILSVDYFLKRHKWIFFSDRIEIQHLFRKKIHVLKYDLIKLKMSSGGLYEGNFKLLIKYIDENKNPIFIKYSFFLTAPDPEVRKRIYEFALKHKIKMEGDWN
ncbi:MAG: hypothetical protein ACOVRK_12445 [Chryseobacterium taeanense]